MTVFELKRTLFSTFTVVDWFAGIGSLVRTAGKEKRGRFLVGTQDPGPRKISKILFFRKIFQKSLIKNLLDTNSEKFSRVDICRSLQQLSKQLKVASHTGLRNSNYLTCNWVSRLPVVS
jgi:hypothetical protein